MNYKFIVLILPFIFYSFRADAVVGRPIEIPDLLPAPSKNNTIHLTGKDLKEYPTNIQFNLQDRLTKFIASKGNPISTVVVADVATGKLLVMAQGREPKSWGGSTHTALHNQFPAASLFKTVVATALLEFTELTPDEIFKLKGSCSDVNSRGLWLDDDLSIGGPVMTLRRAFGKSCNSFFAKLAVNHLGIGPLTKMASDMGWAGQTLTDFPLKKSSLEVPAVFRTSSEVVGRFAAGFGNVSISAVHGLWLAVAIANRGIPKPIMLYRDSADDDSKKEPIMSKGSAQQLIDVMKETIAHGTASHAFHSSMYRPIASLVGGKTGTLTGSSPEGLTSLFLGLYPIDKPEIAVCTIVVIEDQWRIKASNLAAEAIMAYRDLGINLSPTVPK